MVTLGRSTAGKEIGPWACFGFPVSTDTVQGGHSLIPFEFSFLDCVGDILLYFFQLYSSNLKIFFMAIVLMECLWVTCIFLTLAQLIPTPALGVTLTMEIPFHLAM